MHENNIVPAATLILGLPEETPDDLMKTAELLDRLRPYRSLIVPLMFVPMGVLKNKNWFLDKDITAEHIEVLRKCLWHSIYWAEEIIDKFYMKSLKYLPIKWSLKFFIKYATYKGKWVEKRLGLTPSLNSFD